MLQDEFERTEKEIKEAEHNNQKYLSLFITSLVKSVLTRSFVFDKLRSKKVKIFSKNKPH